jgi:Na+/phosphate symporter
MHELHKYRLEVSMKQFNTYLMKYLGQALTTKEKESIWETFKVKDNIEDNPDSIDDRVINLQALVNARKSGRMKKINEIIQMEEEEEQMAEDIKAKGLSQV